MIEGFEFTLHAPNSPAFGRFSADSVLPLAHVLVLPCVGGRQHRGWSSWGSIDRWWCVEEGDTKERGGRTTEAEVARERERASLGGSQQWRKGEIRGTQYYDLALPLSLSFMRQSRT